VYAVLSNIIKRLSSGLNKQSLASQQNTKHISSHKNDAVSIWQDTGQVYYLENTLKLTYTSNSGVMTLEKLSLDELPNVIKALDAMPAGSPLARATVAQQDDAYVVSVCGVTWQKSHDSVRIKALPEAAMLRSKTHCFTKSQAVFKHAFLLEHDDLLTPSIGSKKEGVYTYNRISIEDFAQQLVRANERIAPPMRKSIPVHSDNFKTAFTEHEQSVIDVVLGHNVDQNHTEQNRTEQNITDENFTGESDTGSSDKQINR
jgi:hypothetical protein|tara:strand:- start:10346 stop:11122 length:777 start_codon:yes stop_codon:yes gene_type:complete